LVYLITGSNKEKNITGIYDYMYVLGELKPGQNTEVVAKRGDKEIAFKVVMKKRTQL